MPHPESSDQLDLAGSLLLAAPSLRDPSFCRSVILMTNHGASEGAHGYVLNRPLGKRVGELLSDDEFAELRDIPVFEGGPVSTEQLTFASLHWEPESDLADGRLRYETHLSSDAARARVAEGFKVRAFVGYAGWSAGQLESELEQKAWITCDSDESVESPETATGLWSGLLRKMGPYFALVAGMPDDVSKN